MLLPHPLCIVLLIVICMFHFNPTIVPRLSVSLTHSTQIIAAWQLFPYTDKSVSQNVTITVLRSRRQREKYFTTERKSRLLLVIRRIINPMYYFVSLFLWQTHSHLKLWEFGRCHMSFRWHLSLRKAKRSGLGALAGGPAIHHGDRVVNGLCNSVSDEWPWKGVPPLTLLWSIQ